MVEPHAAEKEEEGVDAEDYSRILEGVVKVLHDDGRREEEENDEVYFVPDAVEIISNFPSHSSGRSNNKLADLPNYLRTRSQCELSTKYHASM